MHLRDLCATGILLITPLLLPAAHADDPTTTSTTTQSTDASATNSPKSALKAYNLAMRNGDVAGMMALQHTVSDDELHRARCNSQADLQVAALEQAARDKFGEAGEKQIAAAMNDEDDAAVDAAKETINGSHAEVQFLDSDSPVPMIRSGDRWALDVQATLRASNGDANSACDQIIRPGQRREGNRTGTHGRPIQHDLRGGRGAEEPVKRKLIDRCGTRFKF